MYRPTCRRDRDNFVADTGCMYGRRRRYKWIKVYYRYATTTCNRAIIHASGVNALSRCPCLYDWLQTSSRHNDYNVIVIMNIHKCCVLYIPATIGDMASIRRRYSYVVLNRQRSHSEWHRVRLEDCYIVTLLLYVKKIAKYRSKSKNSKSNIKPYLNRTKCY